MDLMLLSLSLKDSLSICFCPVIDGESEQRQSGATYCLELFLKELELFLKKLFKTCFVHKKKLREKKIYINGLYVWRCTAMYDMDT